jgi:predicted AlkP superfamily pyrophosphatase or phosphodiesterase
VLDELVDTRTFELVSAGQVLGVNPREGKAAQVRTALLKPHPNMQCYGKEGLPPHWLYGEHPRVPEITCQAEPGWNIATRQWLNGQRERKLGAHGYDPSLPQMRALFVAAGPAFRAGHVLPPVRSVDVYALLCQLLGIDPAPHQGDPRAFDSGLTSARARH